MPAMKNRTVLTTGMVASICKVASRTVSKWVDAGHIEGYRIPGSKDRRVNVKILVDFMKKTNIPLSYFEDAGYTLIDESSLRRVSAGVGIEEVEDRFRRCCVILDNGTTASHILKKVLEKDHRIPTIVATEGFELGFEVAQGIPTVTVINIDHPFGIRILETNKERDWIPTHRILLTGSDSAIADKLIKDEYAVAFTPAPLGIGDIIPYFKSSK